MVLLGLALICALIGILPLFIARRKEFVLFVGLFVVMAIFDWAILYISTPSTVYPLFGIPGFLVFCNLIISALCGSNLDSGKEIFYCWIPAIFLLIVYLSTFILSSSMLRHSDYAALVGKVETRTWTEDIQPKDPKHMRMATRSNAIYMAKKVLGEAGAIGSQFRISEEHMTLQEYKKELWYIVPLDYAGFRVWTSTKGCPGYIMVHGEDPHRQPKLIRFPEGKAMKYMPGAYWADYLERHLRNKGYVNYGLTDETFEIDEEGNPWWVVSVFKPTIMWSGERIEGVIIVDPFTGDDKYYRLGQVPDWVDRAVPKSFVENYLTWQGRYSGGWINSLWGSLNLTEPEKPIMVYGAEGQPIWVTGITSADSSDDSLIGLAYTNSRTGITVFYATKGGGTDKAVLDAVNKNSDVQYLHLHGDDPQLYNVYNTMASIVPLMNESNAFQGVAIVNINDVQKVAVGKDQYEALRNYQKKLSSTGHDVALDNSHKVKVVEGMVDRIKAEIFTNGSVYYIHIDGIPHLFTGAGSALSPILPITEAGDMVRIEIIPSGEDVEPMLKFDNLSLPLESTKAQMDVKERGEKGRSQDKARKKVINLQEKLKSMTPDELSALEKLLSKE